MPMPLAFVVKKASNSWPMLLEPKPIPESRTETTPSDGATE